MLAVLLSSCGAVIQAPLPTQPNTESTQTEHTPATQELTLVPPTEVATVTDPITPTEIDMGNIIYPPLSNVQENFEKGEYDTGLETIKQWVGVWEKMGVFEELEIEINSLSPVPLDGRARIVCVDTRKKGEYTGTMLCPPLDLVNGGLKAVPEEGKWDETDKPLQIIFEEFEKLVTKGSGNELVYQFVDKYTDKATRYFDPATSLIVEGQSLVRDFEIVENEVVIEGTTGVSAEFLLDGNLKINEEAGRKYYLDFINSLAGNEQNRDYMVGLIGASPNGNKLLDYLKNNDYTLPSGLNLPYVKTAGYVNFGQNPIEESIKLDTLKIVVFGPNQWNSDFGGVKEYVTSLKLYKGLWVSSPSISVQYSGWAIDLKDNRLVMVAGAKDFSPENYPNVERMTIGGLNGSFTYERDSAVASGELIQINKLLRLYNKNSPAFVVVSTFGVSCGVQEQSSICDDDITQLFGEGKNLFDSRE